MLINFSHPKYIKQQEEAQPEERSLEPLRSLSRSGSVWFQQKGNKLTLIYGRSFMAMWNWPQPMMLMLHVSLPSWRSRRSTSFKKKKNAENSKRKLRSWLSSLKHEILQKARDVLWSSPGTVSRKRWLVLHTRDDPLEICALTWRPSAQNERRNRNRKKKKNSKSWMNWLRVRRRETASFYALAHHQIDIFDALISSEKLKPHGALFSCLMSNEMLKFSQRERGRPKLPRTRT